MSEQEPAAGPQYELDEETQGLIEVALNCLMTLADAQLDEDARQNLVTIGDALADAFGIAQLELEQDTTDSGEVIYRPKGGLFNDEDEE